MANTIEDLRKHEKTYWLVGITLFGCTVLTLSLGMLEILDFGRPGVSGSDIILGLAVALFKSSLVILIFMHMNHERGLIYKTMCFTMVFAMALMGLTLLAQSDPVPVHSDVIKANAPSLVGE